MRVLLQRAATKFFGDQSRKQPRTCWTNGTSVPDIWDKREQMSRLSRLCCRAQCVDVSVNSLAGGTIGFEMSLYFPGNNAFAFFNFRRQSGEVRVKLSQCPFEVNTLRPGRQFRCPRCGGLRCRVIFSRADVWGNSGKRRCIKMMYAASHAEPIDLSKLRGAKLGRADRERRRSKINWPSARDMFSLFCSLGHGFLRGFGSGPVRRATPGRPAISDQARSGTTLPLRPSTIAVRCSIHCMSADAISGWYVCRS